MNYRIAGCFREANISRLAVLVHFAENNFVDHCNGWFRIQPQATPRRCYIIMLTLKNNALVQRFTVLYLRSYCYIL